MSVVRFRSNRNKRRLISPRCQQLQVLTHVPAVPEVLPLGPTLRNRDIPASFDVHQRESAGHVLCVWLVFGDGRRGRTLVYSLTRSQGPTLKELQQL